MTSIYQPVIINVDDDNETVPYNTTNSELSVDKFQLNDEWAMMGYILGG